MVPRIIMAATGPKARALADYAAAAGVSILAAVVMLRLWSADLRVPLEYGGDALFHGMVVKSVVDHGWYLHNPSLGVPGQLALHDFPVTETFHLLVIKVMALFSGDWALLFNLYFLLGFPLITLSAMAVFRHFRVGFGPAVVGSVLYSFLPSRLLKGEGHLFLDVFYQVPLAILLMLWVCGPEPPLVRNGETGWWPRPHLRGGRSVAAVFICVLIASTSSYYAFFAACLLVAGGIWASFEHRSLANATAGLVLGAFIAAGLLANSLPTLVYQHRLGPNREVAIRTSGEAEVFGMRVAQLFLPAEGHRVTALRELNERYTRAAPMVGENRTTSLGMAGVVGFLALLGRLLSGRRPGRPGPRDDLLRALAVLNFMALLLATMGGFGALIALVLPQIRTYARMNVLIGFFALFAVVLLLERLQNRHRWLGPRLLPLLLALGLLDQTSRTVPPYTATKQEYTGDTEFVRRIEASLQVGAMIFELPYMSFPESEPTNGTHSYDLLRPYLHSRSLRWSFPTMRGRSGDAWALEIAREEPKAMLADLAGTGFSGIVIDRAGYPDRPSKLETELNRLLGEPPLSSRSQRFAFFDITSYAVNLPVDPSREGIGKQYLALHPMVISWTNGFSDAEVAGARTFRWCDKSGEIHVQNDTTMTRKITIKFTAFAAHAPADLFIDGDIVASQKIDLADGGTPFYREIAVPPGSHVLRFHSGGRPAEAPADPRTMVWHADDPVIEELPPAPSP
jgi:phosphoglycerol transferase